MDAFSISFAFASLYAGLGLGFALWFLLRGAARRDPAVPGSTLGARLAWLPASILLWPLLLNAGTSEKPVLPLKRWQRRIWILLALALPLLFIFALRAQP